MSLFFTSDWHIGHEKIIGYCERPFASVDEMHAAMVDRHNEAVSAKDEVWFLGDIAFKASDEQIDVLKALNGHKHIVWGNHDKHHRKLLAPHFETAQDYKELKHDGHLFVMMHYPILSWNRMRHGSIHLHGHCHGTLEHDENLNRLDVGVDAHDFRPVSYEDVLFKLGI